MKISKSYIVNEQQISFICNYFKKNQITPEIPYIKYQFKIENTVLTIYNSNKLVINSSKVEFYEKLLNLNLNNGFKWNNDFEYEIGSDETGTGDFFGGIVVCSTKIKKSDIEKLKQLNIDDSKKINDNRIMILAKQLIEFVEYKIYALSPKQYNKMIEKVKNNNIVKAILHNKALGSFDKTNSYICIDQFVNKNKYYEYLHNLRLRNIVQIDVFETKAESKYFSVAVASILARWWLLKQIKGIEKKININIPLGAWSTDIENAANKIIKEYSDDTLKKICKTHFKCFKKLKI